MKKSPVNRELASPSRPARSMGPVRLFARDSQDAPRLGRQQLAADQVEIRQREETEGARQVLGEAAVADLAEAPQALHDVERVLATRPGPRPGAIDGPPPRAQRFVGRGGAAIHPVAHTLDFERLAIRFLPVRLVPVEDTLLPVHQRGELRDVRDARMRRGDTVDPAVQVRPRCSFIPKYHVFPLRVCFISGSRACATFFVELGAAMIVASTIVPLWRSNRFAVSSSLTVSKIAAVRWCSSSRWRKRRIVVSSGTTSSPSSTRANRRMASLS